MPIPTDPAFTITDNQFWYSKCSFAEHVEDKKQIIICVAGLGDCTLNHAAQGKNGRPTKSFTFSDPADRRWWWAHRQETVQIRLLAIDNKSMEKEEDPPPPDGNHTSATTEEVVSKADKLNSEDSILCVGLDIAWFGGAANNPDSQHDCLGWISFPGSSGRSSQVEYGLKRFKLPERDSDATVLLREIRELLSTNKNASRVVFAIDAPIQANERNHLPLRRPAPGQGEIERRACENYLSIKRQFIDLRAGGADRWHPNIQPGAPLATRVQCLVKGLAQFGFELWEEEKKDSEKLVIECFPAEAIWAMKRLGCYLENLTAQDVKAYKKQNGQLLTAEQVKRFVHDALNAFAKPTRVPKIWEEFITNNLLIWMLQDPTWQNQDNLYRGGKLLDDVVDTAICLATAVSYVFGDSHVWQDENCPEDGHIIGPGALESLLRD
jgi:hypothetical protein